MQREFACIFNSHLHGARWDTEGGLSLEGFNSPYSLQYNIREIKLLDIKTNENCRDSWESTDFQSVASSACAELWARLTCDKSVFASVRRRWGKAPVPTGVKLGCGASLEWQLGACTQPRRDLV